MKVEKELHDAWHMIAANLLHSEMAKVVLRGNYCPDFFSDAEGEAWDRLGFTNSQPEKIARMINARWSSAHIEDDIHEAHRLLFRGVSYKLAEKRVVAGYYTYDRASLPEAERGASKLIFGIRPDRIMKNDGYTERMTVYEEVIRRNLEVLRMNYLAPYKTKGFTVGMLNLTLPQRVTV